ncbi:hypothetical protein C474_13414 [Halogeometricum pallidum JCM 14848]|uniref:Uncharacterized protein n=1 Tax=Halogeometricum pallidum JCM 14848 TaxID=1227487 RepID=M0D1J5_HALPD|nr:hypothetical protein C474_13414 [Halogeometricum pallidum JCM 14848]
MSDSLRFELFLTFDRLRYFRSIFRVMVQTYVSISAETLYNEKHSLFRLYRSIIFTISALSDLFLRCSI